MLRFAPLSLSCSGRRFLSTTSGDKKILLFGSGMVAGPFIDYFLQRSNFEVTVATLSQDEAESHCKGHPKATIKSFNVGNESFENISSLVSGHDIVVSFLPAPMHPTIAKACIETKVNMVTASYISEEMQKLDQSAKDSNITIMNEIGLDPGIDHLSAKQIIDDIQNHGGKVTKFISYCGGLPAPEASDNALGYKFSWSPKGVLTAGLNSAKFKSKGKVVSIDGSDLFANVDIVPVDLEHKGFSIEGLPNRNSLPYIDQYGIPFAETVFRGTLRFKGFSQVMEAVNKVGLMDVTIQKDGLPQRWDQLLDKLLTTDSNSSLSTDAKLKEKLAAIFSNNEKKQKEVFLAFKKLNFLSRLPVDQSKNNILDVLCSHLENQLPMKDGDRDLVLMHHIIGAQFAEHEETRTSTLIVYGDEKGETAMARTVGLPAAIATRLIAEGVIQDKGVIAPMTPAIYNPILEELSSLNVECIEKVHKTI